jgi:hypothetical protein
MGPTRRVTPSAESFFYGRRFCRLGERLLTTGVTGALHSLCAWDTKTWSLLWTAPIRTSTSFLVGHDHSWVVTCDPDRVTLRNIADGTELATFAPSIDVRVALDGGRLGALLEGGSRLAILDAYTGRIQSQHALPRNAANLVAAPDGQHVLAVDAVNDHVGFTLWTVNGERLSSFVGSAGEILFRPGANELILAGSFADDFLPVVFDVVSGTRIAVVSGAKKTVAACCASAISADGRWLATVHADERDNHWIVDQRLFLWDLQKRRHERTIELECQRYANAATFIDNRVVVVEAERTLDIWEIALDVEEHAAR